MKKILQYITVALLAMTAVSLPVVASSGISISSPANVLAPGATGSDLTLTGFLSGRAGANFSWGSAGSQYFAVNGATGVISADNNAVFTSNQTTGSNAFAVTTNGARIDFGAGANDYASSDGTTVTFAGPISTTTVTATGNGVLIGSGTGLKMANYLMQNTAPTISSGFGTSPSIVNSNGSAAFQINVGTGGTASSGVIGLPAATNGWVCLCEDITTPGANRTRMTANSTTSCTVTNVAMSTGAATAWTASDKLWCMAMAN